jgi:uncharacterized membrane protein
MFKGLSSAISLFLLLLVFSTVFDLSTAKVLAQSEEEARFKVAKVMDVSELNDNGLSKKIASYEQMVHMKITSQGSDKGMEFWVNNVTPENEIFSVKAKVGQSYVVGMDGDQIFIADYYRQPIIITLIVLFLIILVLIGGSQGIKAAISLLLTGLAIFFIFIPAIKHGLSPLLFAIIVSAFSTAVTMILVAGISKKSLAAILGTTGGVTCAGILAAIVIKLAPLSGLDGTEAQILLANMNYGNTSEIKLDFQGILSAGILISSLGAVMDVAISIASAAQEIFSANPKQSQNELFKHCMTVGKDIMGTMTNTLILAYTGASIPLFILLSNESSFKVLNMGIIATELASATAGSIGLLCAIPITAVISVALLSKESKI